MVRNLFWLIVSFVIVVCGTVVNSEAIETPASSGISLSGNSVGGQNGGSPGSGPCQGPSRVGATGKNRLNIPKPEEDRRGKGKGKNQRQYAKKKRKRKKRGCKKKSAQKDCQGKKKSLSNSEREDISRKKKNGNKTEERFEGNSGKDLGVLAAPKVRSERADDIPMLLGLMKKMGMDRIIDKHIPRHWKQRKLSWGQTAIVWLAYVLSEGDHRKVSVREYVKNMHVILSEIMGCEIDELDFTDDRCGVLWEKFSKREYWEKIEAELSEKTIEVYKLRQKEMTVRCDGTTVSGYHKIKEGGLFQKGVSKDDPNRPQIKIMASALDPLGMPLATDVVSGDRADDVLYRPIIQRMNEYLGDDEVLYVGDCKIGAFETRLYIRSIDKHYLCPLAMTGNLAKEMGKLIKMGVMQAKQGKLIEVYAERKGAEVLMAKGYEYQRKQAGDYEGQKLEWMERVLVVNSTSYAKSQERGLEKRLNNATEKLLALTPPRGPGKRQITDEDTLKAAIEQILKQHKVEGLIKCEYVKEIERTEKYVGKGRGSADRPKKIIERVRYQVTGVKRREYRIKRAKERMGWKIFVTDVSPERLCFGGVVKSYRKEYRVERIFHRLKSRLKISPPYVKREDQIIGMNNFLTLAVRVMTVAEYTVRRSLQKDQAKLKGLHPENPKKLTDQPTAERLFKAFSKITLTIIKSGDSIIRHLTPLNGVQKEILKRLGLDCSIYTNLELNKSPAVLSEW